MADRMFIVSSLMVLSMTFQGSWGQLSHVYQSRRRLSSQRAFLDGDFILGGIFPVHVGRNANNTACTKFNEKGMSWVLAMIYAVEVINKEGTLLPGIKLGYDIRDGCNQVDRAIEASLDFALGPSNAPVSQTGFTFPKTSGRFGPLKSARPCCDAETAKHNSKVVGVVGSASSKISMAVATVFGSMNIPQISYSSTSRLLSDKTKYKSFVRTIPSDVLQVQALADIVAHFKWQYISAVASDDIYGKIGIESLKQEIKNRGMCIAVSSMFSKSSTVATSQDMERIVKRLKNTDAGRKAQVVILFCSNHEAISFLQEAERQGLTGKTWIASESWGDEAAILELDPKVVMGTIGLVPESGDTTGYQQYIRNISLRDLERKHPWIDDVMQKDYNCSIEGSATPTAYRRAVVPSPSNNRPMHISINMATTDAMTPIGATTLALQAAPRKPSDYIKCSHVISPDKNPAVAMNKNGTFLPLGKTPYVMDAVKALTLALKSMICKNGVCSKDRIDSYEFLKAVRKVEFDGLDGKIKFDENGDPSGSYRVNNIQMTSGGKRLHYVDVGGWDGRRTQRLRLLENKFEWSDGSNNIPKSRCSTPCNPGDRTIYGSTKCCWTCVICKRDEISNSTNSEDCYKCPKGWTNNSDHTQCIEMPLEYLRWSDIAAICAICLSVLFFSTTLFVLGVFVKYRDTPVVKGSNRNLSYVLLTAIALCYTLPFLYVGEPTTTLCSIQPVYFGLVFSLCVAIMLTKTQRLLTVFNAKFSALVALRSSRFRHEQRQAAFVIGVTLVMVIIGISATLYWEIETVKDYEAMPDMVVAHCNDDWFKVQIIAMGYVGVLSLVCSVLAFKARKLPENFNEAKHLSFSMFMLCLVWIVSLPAYFGSHGKMRTSIMCFATIFAALFILGFMFFPKVWIILFHSEKNNPNYVRTQTVQHSMGTEVGASMTGDFKNLSPARGGTLSYTPRVSPQLSPRGMPGVRSSDPGKLRNDSVDLKLPGGRDSPQSGSPRRRRRHSASCSDVTDGQVTQGKDGDVPKQSEDDMCTRL